MLKNILFSLLIDELQNFQLHDVQVFLLQVTPRVEYHNRKAITQNIVNESYITAVYFICDYDFRYSGC